MNTEELEFVKDYTEFANNINKAIAEQRSNGRVSPETHKKVSDSFGDVFSKLANMPLNVYSIDVICKMNDYANVTGNTFDLLTLLTKCLTEQNKKSNE